MPNKGFHKFSRGLIFLDGTVSQIPRKLIFADLPGKKLKSTKINIPEI